MNWHPKRIAVFDTEYYFPPGSCGVPVPVCIVTHIFDVDSTRGLTAAGVFRIGWDEMDAAAPPEWLNEPDTVVIAFSGHGDLQVLNWLGWGEPARYVDFMAEMRVLLCGNPAIGHTAGLYRYLDHFQIQHPPKSYKNDLRELILNGSSAARKTETLDYCELDVTLLAELVAKVWHLVDWPRAVGVRGELMKAYSRIEARGLPIDVEMLHRMGECWPDIQDELRQWVNAELGFPIFDSAGVFKKTAVESWLASRGLLSRWPRTKNGGIELDGDELRQWAKRDRQFAVLYEATKTLNQGSHGLRLGVHDDGRARCWMNALGTRTGRCAPKEPGETGLSDRGGGFLFSGARWIRGLLKPMPGMAVAYLDFSGQEILIGAALSGDENLMECYTAHDPYIRFGQLAGALPPEATKKTHPGIRAKFKTVFLGLGYGMGAEALAFRLNTTVSEAAALVALHKRVFRQYWQWADAVKTEAYRRGSIHNIFGWKMHVHHKTRPTSLGNWPIQSAGACMLHAAVIELERAGIRTIATVHDAVLIEAAADEMKSAVVITTEIMKAASELVTRGRGCCRVDAKIITYPERYLDDDDGGMFHRIEAAVNRYKTGMDACSFELDHTRR